MIGEKIHRLIIQCSHVVTVCHVMPVCQRFIPDMEEEMNKEGPCRKGWRILASKLLQAVFVLMKVSIEMY